MLKANGLPHASPGQRPGFREKNHSALKGRHKRVAHAQRYCAAPPGLWLLLISYPGRCPGLVYLARLGAWDGIGRSAVAFSHQIPGTNSTKGGHDGGATYPLTPTAHSSSFTPESP